MNKFQAYIVAEDIKQAIRIAKRHYAIKIDIPGKDLCLLSKIGHKAQLLCEYITENEDVRLLETLISLERGWLYQLTNNYELPDNVTVSIKDCAKTLLRMEGVWKEMLPRPEIESMINKGYLSEEKPQLVEGEQHPDGEKPQLVEGEQHPDGEKPQPEEGQQETTLKFPIKKKYKPIIIRLYEELNEIAFKMTESEFCVAIEKADFSAVYFVKGSIKNKISYLIYILSKVMGNAWYGQSANSIGLLKSRCSGANVEEGMMLLKREVESMKAKIDKNK